MSNQKRNYALDWLNMPFTSCHTNQKSFNFNKRWIAAISYILSIIFGNLVVNYFGIVNWFGLIFPAGAIFIGLTFSLRDFTQQYWGTKKVWIFILISAVVTLFMNWKIAAASVVAFLVSESVDWLVFTITKKPLHHRIWISNLFSTPLDSILFVTIAFGWNFDAIWGQAIIKYLSGLLVIPFIVYFYRKKNKLLAAKVKVGGKVRS